VRGVEAETEVTTHGVTTVTKTLSVNDYFSQKMKKLKKKTAASETQESS